MISVFARFVCSFLHQARTLGHNPFTIVCAINALLLPCNQFSVYSPLTPSTITPSSSFLLTPTILWYTSLFFLTEDFVVKNSNVFLASLQCRMTEPLYLKILGPIFLPFACAYSCNCIFSQYFDSFPIPTPAPCDMCETGVDVGGGAFRSHLAQVSVALKLLLQLLLLLLLSILLLLPLSAGVHCTLAQRIEARG